MYAPRGSARATVRPNSPCRRQPRGSALLATLTGAAVGIIVAVTTSFVVVALDTTEQARPAVPTPADSTSPPTTAPTTPSAQPAAPALTPATSTAVRSLPAGLSCRDLRNGSFSYAAAFQYWRLHGNPVRMDANRDGIPCETVYSTAAVNAFWYQ